MTWDSKRILYALYFPCSFLLLLWGIEVLGVQFGVEFERYGIYPRDFYQLYGIFLEPLIHDGFSHLWSNTVPLFLLLWALFFFYGEICFRVFGLVWVLSGLLTWVIGRPAYHIGASGLIYGVAFFLFFSGIIRRSRALMALSAIVAFIYGSIVWNMFPISELISPEISWEGHLSGAISGLALAYLYRNQGPQRESIFKDESEEIGDDDRCSESEANNKEENENEK